MIINLNSPWPYLATAVFIALMGGYALRHPRRPGSRYFTWMVIAWLVWALAAALYSIVQSVELRYWLWVIQGICPLVAAPAQLLFTLEYTGQEKWISRRNLFLLSIPVVIMTLAYIFLPRRWTSVVISYSGIEVVQTTAVLRGVMFAYIGIIMLIVVSLLLVSITRSPAFRVPNIWIMVGQVIPVVAYAVVVPLQAPVPPIQITILFTNVTVLAYSVALYYHILQVVPVARDTVVLSMPYSLLVLDAEDRLVDFNAEAQHLPELPGKLALRQPAAEALGDWWGYLSPLIGTKPITHEVVLHSDGGQQNFEIYSMPLLQASGWRMGQAFALQDVTQARRLQQQQSQLLWAQATLQEREQLANELHDGLSQGLAFLGLQAQTAQIYIQDGQIPAAQTSLIRLTEAAGEIQSDTRGLIGDLLAVSLPAESFCATLRQVLERFKQETGLEVRMELDGQVCSIEETLDTPIKLPPAVAVQLIRITQEALANVRKHAQDASQVSIALKIEADQVILAIADDGMGFNPEAQPGGEKHFGLQVMRQRAARIGGQITISSSPGTGARVEVRAPMTMDEIASSD
jgi:signal transduction histidine kinase